MHISEFADDLLCQHCWKSHGTKLWPVNGDNVPYYAQKEPGNYTLKLACPHCGKDWYVVWDDYPGEIEELSI